MNLNQLGKEIVEDYERDYNLSLTEGEKEIAIKFFALGLLSSQAQIIEPKGSK